MDTPTHSWETEIQHLNLEVRTDATWWNVEVTYLKVTLRLHEEGQEVSTWLFECIELTPSLLEPLQSGTRGASLHENWNLESGNDPLPPTHPTPPPAHQEDWASSYREPGSIPLPTPDQPVQTLSTIQGSTEEEAGNTAVDNSTLDGNTSTEEAPGDRALGPIAMTQPTPPPTQQPITTGGYRPGTPVFFWASNSQVVYGKVKSTSRMPDGTLVLVIEEEDGKVVSLPAAGVTKVN